MSARLPGHFRRSASDQWYRCGFRRLGRTSVFPRSSNYNVPACARAGTVDPTIAHPREPRERHVSALP